MKGSIAVVAVFIAGCMAGVAGWIDIGVLAPGDRNITVYILYVLMFLVGIGIGHNPRLGEILKNIKPATLLLPLGTITGSLLFSAAAGSLFSQWGLSDSLAVGSCMGYYSLSSVLISQYKEPSLGETLAAELGAIALLANVFREIFTLTGTPLLARYFGPLAPIASAGVTSVDVSLPVIIKYSGGNVLPAAIIHGVVTDFSVPLLIPLFCSF